MVELAHCAACQSHDIRLCQRPKRDRRHADNLPEKCVVSFSRHRQFFLEKLVEVDIQIFCKTMLIDRLLSNTGLLGQNSGIDIVATSIVCDRFRNGTPILFFSVLNVGQRVIEQIPEVFQRICFLWLDHLGIETTHSL